MKAGGHYICERCGTGLASKDNLARHYAKYEITTPNGTMEERKLCVIEDAELSWHGPAPLAALKGKLCVIEDAELS